MARPSRRHPPVGVGVGGASRRASDTCALFIILASVLMIGPAVASERGSASLSASGSEPAAGRPYSVDDMLAQEAFGKAEIDPAERYLVFERQDSYERSARFDFGRFSPWTRSTLWIKALNLTDPPKRLLASSEGDGHVLGPWSPSGKRLLIYRLLDDRLQPGVVEIQTGEVRWLDLSSEVSIFGATAEWKDDEVLVLMVRPDLSLPWHLRTDRDAMRATAAGWRDFATGETATATLLGAGAFAKDAPRERQNSIVRVSAEDGSATELARGWFQDMVLSPDGLHLAASETGAPLPVDPLASLLPGDRPMIRTLHLISLETGTDDRPMVGNLAPGLLAWSLDSRRLLVWSREAESLGSSGQLVAVRPGTRQVERFDAQGLIPETGQTATTSFTTVFADWLGDMPVLFARPPGTQRADWYGLRSSDAINLTAGLPSPVPKLESLSPSRFATLAAGRAWIIDRSGRSKPVTGQDGLRSYSPYGLWDPPRLRLNAPPRRAWFQVLGPDDRLHSIPFEDTTDTQQPRPFSPSSPKGANIIASSRRWSVDLEVSNGVQTLHQRRYGNEPQVLAILNTYLGAVVFSHPTPISHPGPGGENLTSWLYPPTIPVHGRIPFIVLSYPGGGGRPQAEPWAFNGQSNLQLLTAEGYAVLVPALPRDRYPSEPAAGLTDQILHVVDAALASHPELDPTRIAYWGHSFGGYAGLVAATQTSRFKTYVIAAGLSDLATAWGEFSPTNQGAPWDGLSIRQRAGWAEQSQGAMGGPPWSDPDRYVRNSPLFSADRIHAPILLVQGDRDIVPLTQSELMFSALWRQNKDVQLLTYGGEDHTLASPANVRDFNRRTLQWLDRTLGPQSPAIIILPAGGSPSVEPSSQPSPD